MQTWSPLFRAIFLSGLVGLPTSKAIEIAPAYQRNRIQFGSESVLMSTTYSGENGVPTYHPGVGTGYLIPQSFFSGTWYRRPYPHHLDYYRWRYANPQVLESDCPCDSGDNPQF